jgi:thiamine biosynthesis lipoprotein
VPLFKHPFVAMGGPCELRLHAADEESAARAARAAIAEVLRLHERYSRYREDSVTSAINRAAGGAAGIEVDAETAGLLDYARTAHAQSGGLFDITSGVLRRAWDFKSGRPPEPAAIDALLPLIGWDKVGWHDGRLTLPLAGMQLDFGGLVKEYAADRAAGVCRDFGVHSGLVELGGDIAVIGPPADRGAWGVGIRNPRDPANAIATIDLAAGAIASSGDYERYLEVNGRRYCHILNPKTGWPAQGLASVSVVAQSCLVAGTVSTIAMLKGPAEGPAWLASLGLPHLYVDVHGRVGGSSLDDGQASMIHERRYG